MLFTGKDYDNPSLQKGNTRPRPCLPSQVSMTKQKLANFKHSLRERERERERERLYYPQAWVCSGRGVSSSRFPCIFHACVSLFPHPVVRSSFPFLLLVFLCLYFLHALCDEINHSSREA